MLRAAKLPPASAGWTDSSNQLLTLVSKVLIAGQVEDGAVVLGEDGFGVWVLMLGVQGFGWGGRLEGQAVVSLTACRAEDSSTMPVLAA